MSSITRGAKNAFRNPIRTVSVMVILSISIGLALIMLLSLKAVDARIASVKSVIGNTLTVSPAGSRGFEGGGEPLTETDIASIATAPNVTSVTKMLNGRITPGTDTSLVAAIDAGTIGGRQGRTGRVGAPDIAISGRGPSGGAFKLPVTVTAISDVSSIQALGAEGTSITAGTKIDGATDTLVSMVGKTLAEKNSLTVGSTFTAYDNTFTVSGIFDAGNTFANNSIYIPLPTLQRLAVQPGEITTAVINVNSIDNLSTVEAKVKEVVGTKGDVTSSQDTSAKAVEPLQSIRTISLYSLFGSLVAGAIVTFLIMLMIVRERRREIGVLKAIGASNASIVTQFISESLVLTLIGSLLGTVLGVVLSNPVLKVLVNTSTSTTENVVRGPGGPGGFAARIGGFGGAAQNAVHNLQTTVGFSILLYGLLAAVIIAILGSSIPAWLIAKIRPAEVMRGE